MKKIIGLMVVMMSVAMMTASAQNYMLIDSEKVYKSIDEYVKGLEDLDKLGEKFQTEVDLRFEALEDNYQRYLDLRGSLTQSVRNETEAKILLEEKNIVEFQKEMFGEEGTLIKRRMEMMEPIKKKVDEEIQKYALEGGFQLVMDLSSNPSIVFYVPSLDKTEQIIQRLK